MDQVPTFVERPMTLGGRALPAADVLVIRCALNAFLIGLNAADNQPDDALDQAFADRASALIIELSEQAPDRCA